MGDRKHSGRRTKLRFCYVSEGGDAKVERAKESKMSKNITENTFLLSIST
jgi:hypothetical protein